MTTRTITVEALAAALRVTGHIVAAFDAAAIFAALSAEPAGAGLREDELAHLRRPGGFVSEDMGTGWSQRSETTVAATPPSAGLREALEWPTLANVIREVDGNHDLGAGELAERLLSHPRVRAALAATPVGEEEQ